MKNNSVLKASPCSNFLLSPLSIVRIQKSWPLLCFGLLVSAIEIHANSATSSTAPAVNAPAGSATPTATGLASQGKGSTNSAANSGASPSANTAGSTPHSIGSGGSKIVSSPLGQVQSLFGDVRVIRQGTPYQAKVGSPLSGEDVLTTGKKSQAKVAMSDKNIVILQAESELKVKSYFLKKQDHQSKQKNAAVFEIPQGSTRFQIEALPAGESLEVRTPSAVVGVRGTDFLVKHQGDTTEVITFDGVVEFGERGIGDQILNSVKVSKGSGGRLKKGEKPAVMALAELDLSTQEQKSKFDPSLGEDKPQGTK